jgi:hypothetical protein
VIGSDGGACKLQRAKGAVPGGYGGSRREIVWISFRSTWTSAWLSLTSMAVVMSCDMSVM